MIQFLGVWVAHEDTEQNGNKNDIRQYILSTASKIGSGAHITLTPTGIRSILPRVMILGH
jgi:hypothetical protein